MRFKFTKGKCTHIVFMDSDRLFAPIVSDGGRKQLLATFATFATLASKTCQVQRVFAHVVRMFRAVRVV